MIAGWRRPVQCKPTPSSFLFLNKIMITLIVLGLASTARNTQCVSVPISFLSFFQTLTFFFPWCRPAVILVTVYDPTPSVAPLAEGLGTKRNSRSFLLFFRLYFSLSLSLSLSVCRHEITKRIDIYVYIHSIHAHWFTSLVVLVAVLLAPPPRPRFA